MLRVIIVLAGLILSLASARLPDRLEAVYDVSFGLLGKVGQSHAVLDVQHGRYRISIDMKASGMADSLSGHRREKHISEGVVKNGKLVARRYEVVRTYKNKKVKKVYRFDPKKRKIFKIYEKYENNRRYAHQESVLPYYSEDDLLTLYFNLDRYINKRTPGHYRFKAAGAERQGGFVEVIVPTASQRGKYEEDLGKGAAWYATAIIHQKLFTDNEGRLELAVGSDGITQKALIKDVALFGDVTAVRVK